MGNTTRTIFRNTLFNWAHTGLNLLVAFFLSPFLVRTLGDSGYGLWTLIGSLTGYLALLDFGVRAAVTQYMARFHASADHERSSRILWTALLIFSTTGAAAVSLSAIVALFLGDLFQIPAGQLAIAKFVLILGGANVAVSLVAGVFGGIVVGLQRFDLMNTLDIALTALRAITIVLALTAGYGLRALASIHLAFSMARGLGSTWLSLRVYPELRANPASPSLEHARLIFSFGLFSFLIGVGRSLIYATDYLVVGTFLPVSLITFYAIGGLLVDSTRGLLSGVSTTLTPAASALDERRDKEGLQHLLFTGMQFMTLLAFPIGVGFLMRGHTFIGLWMGPQFADLSSPVLQVLAVSLMFSAASHPGLSLALGMRKHRAIVPATLAEGIVNLFLSLLFVRSLGIVGVAWGTTIPSVLRDVIFWPWFLRRVLGISLREFAIKGWVLPGISVVPYALVSHLVDRHWPAPHLFVFFLQVIVVLPTALLPLWFTSFTATQRKAHWDGVKSFIRASNRQR